MRTSTGLLLAGIGVLATHFMASCSSATCEDKGNCGATGEDGGGNRDADADGAPIPEGCDPAADVKDAPKCVDNSFGIFVDAAGGVDTGEGTKSSPVKTIAAALGKLGGKSRIYLCGEGPYAEAVKLTSAVSLYGGFACGGGNWSYNGAKAKLARNDEGVGLEVRGATSAVVVSDVAVDVKDATAASGSSVAVFAVSSSKVVLRRVAATAGTGKDGTDATDQPAFLPASAANGNDGASGGGQKENTACATSIGGAGGGGTGNPTANGINGKVAVDPVFPMTPLSNGAGGLNSVGDCGNGSSGRNGSYGPGGASGTGATKLGELTAEGWKVADGAAGGAGTAGQGGGGGARINTGGVGGSGGPGGCGGAGGAAGTGGGASIAVLAFETAVVLEQTSLSSKQAGRGGRGAKGQKAQLGGAPGTYNNFNDACTGGGGGIGGSGGGGGGGAGGVSAGVLYKGTPPTLNGASTPSVDTHPSVTLGGRGAAGTKGAGGDAARTNNPASHPGGEASPAAEGDAKAILSAP